MSRTDSDYDEYDPLAAERWRINTERTINGKRGQKILREIEAALLALPEPKLAYETFDDGQQCCVLGAYARHKGLALDEKQREQLNDPFEGYGDAVAEWAQKHLGMTFTLAWNLVSANDDMERWSNIWQPDPNGRVTRNGETGYWREATPEERYDHVLRWVRSRIKADA